MWGYFHTRNAENLWRWNAACRRLPTFCPFWLKFYLWILLHKFHSYLKWVFKIYILNKNWVYSMSEQLPIPPVPMAGRKRSLSHCSLEQRLRRAPFVPTGTWGPSLPDGPASASNSKVAWAAAVGRRHRSLFHTTSATLLAHLDHVVSLSHIYGHAGPESVSEEMNPLPFCILVLSAFFFSQA